MHVLSNYENIRMTAPVTVERMQSRGVQVTGRLVMEFAKEETMVTTCCISSSLFSLIALYRV